MESLYPLYTYQEYSTFDPSTIHTSELVERTLRALTLQ